MSLLLHEVCVDSHKWTQESQQPATHLHSLITVALDSEQDPICSLSKVLMKRGSGEGKHLPSCGAA